MLQSKPWNMAVLALFQSYCHNQQLFALASDVQSESDSSSAAANTNTVHENAQKSREANAAKMEQLAAKLRELQQRLNTLKKQKQEVESKEEEQKANIKKFEDLESTEKKGALQASHVAVDGDPEHDKLTTGLHAEIATHENKMKELEQELKKTNDEIKSLEEEIAKAKEQRQAVDYRDRADQAVLAATSECDDEEQCSWNENIQLSPLSPNELFVMSKPPQFAKLTVNFEPQSKSDKECKLDVLIGVNQQCAKQTKKTKETKEKKDAAMKAHQICKVHSNQNGTHLHLCRHCDGAVFDVAQLVYLQEASDKKKAKQAKEQKAEKEQVKKAEKVCLILQNEGDSECTVKASVVLKASADGQEKSISCPKHKTTDAAAGDSGAGLEAQPSAAWKVQTGYLSMIVTIVVLVVSVLLGVYVVIV